MPPASIDRLLKVGFSYEQARLIQTIDDTTSSTTTTTTSEPRTTVRVATAAGATVVPVAAVTNLAVNDVVVVGDGTAGAEERTITAVDATVGAETITVGVALANAHALNESVVERVTTTTTVVSEVDPTYKNLIRGGFTRQQARVLISGTSTTPPSMKALLTEAHFTRPQAKLIRGV